VLLVAKLGGIDVLTFTDKLRGAFRAAVARTVGVARADVLVLSVKAAGTYGRRRLQTAGVEAEAETEAEAAAATGAAGAIAIGDGGGDGGGGVEGGASMRTVAEGSARAAAAAAAAAGAAADSDFSLSGSNSRSSWAAPVAEGVSPEGFVELSERRRLAAAGNLGGGGGGGSAVVIQFKILAVDMLAAEAILEEVRVARRPASHSLTHEPLSHPQPVKLRVFTTTNFCDGIFCWTLVSLIDHQQPSSR
jgi:hypothetical protein